MWPSNIGMQAPFCCCTPPPPLPTPQHIQADVDVSARQQDVVWRASAVQSTSLPDVP